MRLIYPKQISEEKAETLRLCIAKSGIEISSDEILSAVREQLTSIEAGVQIIDQEFPVPKVGKVDFIACDRNGNLLLINLSLALDAKQISHILGQADWIINNREVFEHFYFVNRESCIVNRHQINDQRSTIHDLRIWCLAGSILPEAESLLRHLDSNTPLEVFTYNCLILSGERWLVVQKVVPSPLPVLSGACPELGRRVEGGGSLPNNYDQLTTIHDSRDTRYELTQEEIDDFFSEDEEMQKDFDPDEEEITYVGPYFE